MFKNNVIRAMVIVSALSFAACAPDAQNAGDPAITAATGPAAPDSEQVQDNARLEALYQQRIREKSDSDFTVGPGDILEVSVPEVEELKDRSVRVSGDNTIALPLIGVVNVKGMTEQGVRDALKQRLDKYMYNPQVDVFAKEYQSRQVAVVGMVQKPGLYTMTSASDTVLAMISRAGGATSQASQRILLVPAEPGGAQNPATMMAAASQFDAQGPPPAVTPTSASATAASAIQPAQPEGAAAAHADGASVPASYKPQPAVVPQQFGHIDPIVINLSTAAGQRDLNIPARPGDVIIVPAQGQVMVKGWVQNPGAFQITPRMTVLGAVTAAGGQMFSSSAVILRTSNDGGQVEIPVDLSAIEKRQSPDVPVQAGDVVIVNKSVAGAVPYALYELFNKFGTGLGMGVPLF
jgi:protein involved in polysaccharide export with SLBB domain